jgi:AraC-like DNA-binding protein
MDLHKASDYDVKPTAEEIKRNHIADLAVQDKYKVRFLQYWINEEAGMVFCLMEAPDKESCAAVHQEAHGGMPCQVIELKGGDYLDFMGDEGRVNEFDIVENSNGSFDRGYRMLLVADILSVSDAIAARKMLVEIVNKKGRIIPRSGSRILAAFTGTEAAIACATWAVNAIKEKFGRTCEIRIGLCAGQPVTEKHEFFEESMELANCLCTFAKDGQVLMDPLLKELCNSSISQAAYDSSMTRFLSRDEESFLHMLSSTLNPMLGETHFSVDTLASKSGMSRSQLYRKITAITGLSANSLIKEMRLRRALELLDQQFGNVTQVALEVGFNNPSYFARNFQERFGVAPMKVSKRKV